MIKMMPNSAQSTRITGRYMVVLIPIPIYNLINVHHIKSYMDDSYDIVGAGM
jgi:hypothetical protein